MAAGVCCAVHCCHLCLVHVSHAVLPGADVDTGSLVHSDDSYYQHEVFLQSSHTHFLCILSMFECFTSDSAVNVIVTIRYKVLFVASHAGISQLNLPHGPKTIKWRKKTTKK